MPERKRHAADTAIAGAGAVGAGTGLAAGGIPGGKSDFTTVLNLKEPKGKTKVGRAASAVVQNKHVARAAPGGILGFRTHAHKGGMYGFQEQAKKQAARSVAPDKVAHHAFSHGYTEGKIAPEVKIIRHMSGGKKAAAGALIGGGAATVYGVKHQKVHKAEKHADQYHGALAGTGAAGLAVSAGGHKLFRGQEKVWRTRANRDIDAAQKLVPGLGGRKSNQNIKQYRKHLRRGGTAENFPKTMEPERPLTEIMRDKKVFHGVAPETAKKAGSLRGAAAQAEHFSHVYGSTAKVVGRARMPSAIVGAAGVGGLAASRMKNKKPVSKRMSAFGVEH